MAIAAVLAFQFLAATRPAAPFAVGDLAADFDLAPVGFEGRVRLSDLRGKPVVLAILDTRWPSFLDAVEGLERLNRALRRRGLAVVGVFVDADAAAPKKFVADYPELTFTPAIDPGGHGTAAGYGRPQAPELVIIDREGRIAARSTEVAEWRKRGFQSRVAPYVEPEKPGL